MHTVFFLFSERAVLWLRQYVLACLSPQQPGFYLRPGHVGFVVDRVALGQGIFFFSSPEGFVLPPFDIMGYTVAQLVEAPCYKPEGRGFDSRWCRWNFSLT